MRMKKTKDREVSFEEQLGDLEGLTKRLESGELTLEQSLEAYEKGVAISRKLLSALDAAEKRIEVLNSQTGRAERGGDAPAGDAEGLESADQDPDGENS